MRDYTPDTTVIHSCYLECTDWASYEGKSVSEVSNERDAEFDRWLAEVKAQACTHTFAQQLEEHSLAELIRMAKADAWEEGYAHGNADAFTEARLDRDNPYRQEEPE